MEGGGWQKGGEGNKSISIPRTSTYTVLLMSHDTYHIITHQFTGIKYNREKYKSQESV